MEPFVFIKQELEHTDDAWQLLPDNWPADAEAEAGWSTFIPGDRDIIESQVHDMEVSNPATFIPTEGGVFILGSLADLEKIVKRLRR